MASPLTEFRILDAAGEEPADRTTAGIPAGEGSEIDFGTFDTSDEAREIPVTALVWRVTDMNGAEEVTNIRVWLEGLEEYSGSSCWHMDISDTWSVGKTAVEVREGTPGAAPGTRPEPNLTRIGGGTISGTSHADSSQYIYLAGTIAVDEPVGGKNGLRLRIDFDYS